MLKDNCPDSFKELGGSRCQIVVDSIDLLTFKKVNEYLCINRRKIDDFLEGEKMPTKKTKN